MDEALKGQIRSFAMGRIGIGAVAVLAPRLILRPWVGKSNNTPATRMLARMAGARDIALGIGAVFALNHDAPVRGWLEGASVADSGDFLATLLTFRHLSRFTATASALASLGGAAYGRYLVSQLPATAAATAAPTVVPTSAPEPPTAPTASAATEAAAAAGAAIREAPEVP